MPEHTPAMPRKHAVDPDVEALIDLLAARTTALIQAREALDTVVATAVDVQHPQHRAFEMQPLVMRLVRDALTTIEATLGEGKA